MSSFPIVPRAGGPDRAPPRAVALPSLDLGKISFAAMGGSAEILHFPENDVAYDVDSSDEDLDGMEAAVAAFEARRARAREMAAARARSSDADERLAREKAETETSLRLLRARRERFEAALAAREPVKETRRIGKAYGQIDVEDARSTAFAEAAALEALRQRRARIDARIAALLGECRPERKDAADDASSVARAARAAAAVDAEYVAPKWKQRRDRRRAEEEAAARRSAQPDGGESEKRDENPKNANGAVANEDAIRAAFAAAARLTRRGDAEGLRSMLETDPTREFLNGRLDDHVPRRSPRGDGDDATLDENAGFTLLTLACGLGDWPSARCLLRRGADINAPDRFERAPVDAAVHEGHFDLADALVRWAEERGVRMGEQ
jgi:hypothetical protein